MSNSGAEKRGRSIATSWNQRAAIVSWLQIRDCYNFRWITGSAQADMSSVVAGSKLTKQQAYVDLASYVNQRCCSNWSWENAEARYSAYIQLYKKISRKLSDPTGPKYCLSQQDLKKGITTIEEKLEKDCPFYSVLDQLYGDRQNVRPAHEVQSTSQNVSELFAWAEDDEDNDDTPPVELQPSSINLLEEDIGGQAEEATAASVEKTPTVASQQSAAPKIKKRSLLDSASTVSSASKKKDIATSFAEAKMSDLEFKREKFAWEQKTKEEEMRQQRSSGVEETRRQVMLKLLDQQKSPEEIKEYMDVLFNT
jgi:hypothetical protein